MHIIETALKNMGDVSKTIEANLGRAMHAFKLSIAGLQSTVQQTITISTQTAPTKPEQSHAINKLNTLWHLSHSRMQAPASSAGLSTEQPTLDAQAKIAILAAKQSQLTS